MGIYWILSGKMAVVPSPISEEDIALWARNGIKALLSLYNLSDLSISWDSLDELHRTIKRYGIELLSYPVLSRKAPPPTKVIELITWIDKKISEGKPTAIGCRRGWGRGGAVAAAYLVYKGLEPTEALRYVRQIANNYGETAIDSEEQERLSFIIKELLSVMRKR